MTTYRFPSDLGWIPAGDFPDSSPFNVGTLFALSASASIVGVRFYSPVSQTVNVQLWESGSKVAELTSMSAAIGWNTFTFGSPYAGTTGVDYIVSILIPTGTPRYTAITNKFNDGSDPIFVGVGPAYSQIAGNNVYSYATTIPSTSFNGIWAGVDAILDDGVTVDPAILQSKTGATTGSSITVTLDGTPAVGSTLVLVANSPQGISTPSGYTARATFANDQGFYVWDKVSAGIGDIAVTVTPNSSAPIAVTLLELDADAVDAFDAVSTVDGNSSSATIPISGVTTTGAEGLLLAVGALHGWASPPASPPSYTNGWAHATSAFVGGTGSTLVGHYVGTKASAGAGATGSLAIDSTVTVDNNAGFLVAYAAPVPPPASSSPHYRRRVRLGSLRSRLG